MSPGLQLSWHIENGNFIDYKELVTLSPSGQIKTPSYGSPASSKFLRENHTYYARVHLPKGAQEISDNDVLTVDIDIDLNENAKMSYWTGAKSYVFYNEKKTWSEAQAFCESKRGHLASVVTSNDKQSVDAISDVNDRVWIGGAESKQIGKWTWSDGKPWVVDFWKTGEPLGSFYGCLSLYGNKYSYYRGLWYKSICSSRLPFVLKYETTVS